MIVPALLLIAGLALVALAIVVPGREPAGTRGPIGPAPAERIRELERLARFPGNSARIAAALDDPDPDVGAVAAILLRGCQGAVPVWRR